MSHVFDIAACIAQKMLAPKQKMTIRISDTGGLSSIQKNININGQPHKLSYINRDEASLLRQLGGSGRNVDGIPAYDFSDEDADAQAEAAEEAAAEAAAAEAAAESAAETDQQALQSYLGESTLSDLAGPGDPGSFDSANFSRDISKDMGYEYWDYLAHALKHGPPSAATLSSSTYEGLPVMTEFGWLDQEESALSPEELGYDQPQSMPAVKGADLAMDPFFTNLTSKATKDNSYIHDHWKNTLRNVLPKYKGPQEKENYLATLRRSGIPTYGTGALGRWEVKTPHAMKKKQHDEYSAIYKANIDDMVGKNPYGVPLSAADIRAEIDAADETATLGETLEETGFTAEQMGLASEMNTSEFSDFITFESIKGMLEGLPIAMSIASGSPIGIMTDLTNLLVGPEIEQDIRGLTKSIADQLKEAGFRKPIEEAEKIVKEVENLYEDKIPTKVEVAEQIAKFFGIKTKNYQWFK
jgi:hypothetical protein|tara:strand:- start:15 stop:1424 length:1410 start_codon:yes stop_codon:yes gene_type:complete